MSRGRKEWDVTAGGCRASNWGGEKCFKIMMILHYPVNYTQNPWIVYLKSKFCGVWQTKQVPDNCSRRRAIGTLFISLFLTYKFSIKKKKTFDCLGSLTYKKNCRLLFCSPRVRLLGGLFVHFSQTFECTLTGVCVLEPKIKSYCCMNTLSHICWE